MAWTKVASVRIGVGVSVHVYAPEGTGLDPAWQSGLCGDKAAATQKEISPEGVSASCFLCAFCASLCLRGTSAQAATHSRLTLMHRLASPHASPLARPLGRAHRTADTLAQAAERAHIPFTGYRIHKE